MDADVPEAIGSYRREAAVLLSQHSSPSVRKRRDRDGKMLPRIRRRKEVWRKRSQDPDRDVE